MLWWPQEFCERLASQGRHVIRYDQRDTGLSTKYPPGEVPTRSTIWLATQSACWTVMRFRSLTSSACPSAE